MLSQHPAFPDFARSLNPKTSIAEFEEANLQRIFMIGRSLLQQFETELFLHNAGLLGAGIWEPHRNWAANFVKVPIWRK